MSNIRFILAVIAVACGIAGLKIERLPLKIRLALIALFFVLGIVATYFIFGESDWEY